MFYSILQICSCFKCPKIAVLFTGSFRAVLHFLLTYEEITALNWLKAPFFLLESAKKRTARKEPVK